MENRDLERTEELLKKSKGKKNSKVVIIAIIAALVIAGIGGFAGVKAHKSKEAAKNLDQAEKYLAEGEYEQAVEAYTAAIDIDAKSAPAFKGRARANAKLGKTKEAYSDIDKAIEIDPKDEDNYKVGIDIGMTAGDLDQVDKYIDRLHENVEGTEDVTKGSLLLGSDPSDMSNSGIVLIDGDTVYTAGSDSINVSEGGKDAEAIVSGFKEDGNDTIITGLNKKDGYIYFVSNVDMSSLLNHDAGLHYGKSIYRVRADGSSDPEQIFTFDWDPEKEYGIPNFPTGDYPNYMTTQLAVIGDRIYFNQYMRDWNTATPYKVFSVDLNGKDKKDTGINTNGVFTSDGENIYYIQADLEKIYKYSLADGRSTVLCTPGDGTKMQFASNFNGQVVYYEGNVYYALVSESGIGICCADVSSGEMKTLYEKQPAGEGSMQGSASYGADGAEMSSIVIAVKDGKLYFTSDTTSDMPGGKRMMATISSLELKEGAEPEKVKTIEHDFEKDFAGLGLDMNTEYSTLKIDAIAVNADDVECMVSSEIYAGNNAYYAYSVEM